MIHIFQLALKYCGLSHGEIVHENNGTYIGMTKQLLLQYSLLKALNKIKFGIDYIVANHFLTA